MRRIPLPLMMILLFVLGCAARTGSVQIISPAGNRFGEGILAIVPGGTNAIEDESICTEMQKLYANGSRKLTDRRLIRRAVVPFPAGIVDDDFSSSAEKPTAYLSGENRSRIIRIKRNLGARYMIVLWSEGWTIAETKSGKEYYVTIYTRVIDERDRITGSPSFIERMPTAEKSSRNDIERIKKEIITKTAKDLVDILELKSEHPAER